jgi:putative ABC transport system permease protein
MVPFSYTLRSLGVRPASSIATAAGLGLVVFVLAAALMLGEGVERTIEHGARRDVALVLSQGADAEQTSNIEDEVARDILAAKGVARRTDGGVLGLGEVVFMVHVSRAHGDSGNIQLRGVPAAPGDFHPDVRVVEGRAPAPGKQELMVGRGIAGRFPALALGQSLEPRDGRRFTVVGIFEDGGSRYESEVWGELGEVREAFGRAGVVSVLRVALSRPEAFDVFEQEVEGDRRFGVQVLRETDFLEQQSEGTSNLVRAIGLLVCALFALVAILGAMTTMHASVANRRREIGVLRALGFTRFEVVASFLFEASLLGLAGGSVGAAAALALGLMRLSAINVSSFSEVAFSFEPTAAILIASLAVAVAMGIAGGILPIIRAARLSPSHAMRDA